MARRVADRARIVAEGLETDVTLVHTMEPLTEALIEDGLLQLVEDHRRQAVRELLAWLAARTERAVGAEVHRGSPAWELVRRSKRAELTVVGSSSVDSGRVGPVAGAVARMAAGDVLVVRRQPRVPYRRVVAAVDFSAASRAAISAVVERFPEADITAVFSLPSRFDPILTEAGLFAEEVEADRRRRLGVATDRMERFLTPWSDRVKPVVVDGPAQETIAEVVRRRSADLVAVASRGAGATRMVLLGTVAEALVTEAPCDVLVARVPSAFRRP